MEPLVEVWEIFECGFETTPTPGLPTVRVAHAIWADNKSLLAKTKKKHKR